MRFSKKVEIHPSKLGPSIAEEILELVKSKYENTCTRDFGYITKITDIRVKCIKTEYMSPNAIAHVTFAATLVKPEVGAIFQAKSIRALKQGVMFQTLLFKIFVPEIPQVPDGTEAKIEIVATKYDKNQFSCIGKIL